MGCAGQEVENDRYRISSRPTTSSSPSARRIRSPGSSATSASNSTNGTCRWSTRRPCSRSREGIFFGGDAAWGPKNIIWAVEHGHQAAISIHNYCQGIPVTERLPFGTNLISQKMGISEWSYHNDYNPSPRQKMQHVDLMRRFQQTEHRGRAGLQRRTDRARSPALPELRHSDRLQGSALHRM